MCEASRETAQRSHNRPACSPIFWGRFIPGNIAIRLVHPDLCIQYLLISVICDCHELPIFALQTLIRFIQATSPLQQTAWSAALGFGLGSFGVSATSRLQRVRISILWKCPGWTCLRKTSVPDTVGAWLMYPSTFTPSTRPSTG